MSILWILTLLLHYRGTSNASPGKDTAPYRLQSHLLDGYLQTRPVANWSKTLEIDVGFSLIQIINLDSTAQNLQVTAELPMNWKDDYLQWNVSDYDGITNIHLSTDDIWTPAFTILNRGTGEEAFWDSHARSDSVLNVNSTGHVRWQPGGFISTTCNIFVRDFPFDVQNCTIIIAHKISNRPDIKLTTSDTNFETLARLHQNDGWKLLDPSIKQHEFEKSTEIHVTLQLRRQASSYVMSMFVPMFLLSLIGSLIFALPQESGEKISLGVTVMLGFGVFQLVMLDNLPQTSSEAPLMMYISMILMIMNGISMALSVFILNLQYENTSIRIPHCVRVLVLNYMSCLVCRKTNSIKTDKKCTLDQNGKKAYDLEVKDEGCEDSKGDENDGDLTFVNSARTEQSNVEYHAKYLEENKGISELKEMATVLDRFFFILSIIICVVIILVTWVMLQKK